MFPKSTGKGDLLLNEQIKCFANTIPPKCLEIWQNAQSLGILLIVCNHHLKKQEFVKQSKKFPFSCELIFIIKQNPKICESITNAVGNSLWNQKCSKTWDLVFFDEVAASLMLLCWDPRVLSNFEFFFVRFFLQVDLNFLVVVNVETRNVCLRAYANVIQNLVVCAGFAQNATNILMYLMNILSTPKLLENSHHGHLVNC